MSIGLTQAILNFENLKDIGAEGRNSKVYLAHDKQLNSEIVIKKILKKNFPNVVDYYGEAKRLYDSEHQNVVQIKYACEDTDNIYIAMPFYKNGSIKRLMDNKHLTVRQILRYAIQFLSGVHNIHVKKLIHFDIKPDNILISDNNEALVSDFGLTKDMDLNGLAKLGFQYQSHLPPEAFITDNQSMLFDIYSCGVTLYRMCNGNKIFESQLNSIPDDNIVFANTIKKGNFPDRNHYLPHIPKSLRRIVNKMMHIETKKRYQTILDAINDLSKVDENLDWEYIKNNNGFQYIMNCDDKIYTVNVVKTNQSNTFAIETTKLMKHSNKIMKVSKGCHKSVSFSEVEDKLVQLFNEL